jgi:CRP/FNR family transcriptional regulator, cyclic AMP receptor protein
MQASLFDLDSSLADSIIGEREAAAAALTADILELPRGPWAPRQTAPLPGHLGYLLTSGVIVREICVAASWSAELLNQGDLLRPWLEDAASFVDAEWRVIEPARLLELDPAFTSRLARWPELVDALVERALRRSRSAAVHAAVAGTPRVEDRLLLLFWHMAERRGRREARGVRLDLSLTHSTLAHLVGAQRPTVSTALSRLAERNRIVRLPDGAWQLIGKPPEPREPFARDV